MQTGDENRRKALENLAVPPERARFFEELRERIHEHDRAMARRWRIVSLVLAVMLLAVFASATVLAETRNSSTTTIERTLSCRISSRDAVYVSANVSFHINGDALNPARDVPGRVDVTTWPWQSNPEDARSPVLGQLTFSATRDTPTVDRVRCAASHANVPFTAAHLVSQGTVTAAFNGGTQRVCSGAGRALIHYRITEVGGIPSKAQVAIREADARKAALAYIQWTTKKATVFTRSSCSPFRYIVP